MASSWPMKRKAEKLKRINVQIDPKDYDKAARLARTRHDRSFAGLVRMLVKDFVENGRVPA